MVDKEDGVEVTLHDCPRCGGVHVALKFYKLARPVAGPGFSYACWAECRETGGPVLLEGVPEAGAVLYCRRPVWDADAARMTIRPLAAGGVAVEPEGETDDHAEPPAAAAGADGAAAP